MLAKFTGGGGGFFHQNCTWMCLPDLENLTISIPIFCKISHPSVYHFRKKSTQFASNWVLFTTIIPNIPNLCNLGSFVSDENPPIAIPNFAKSAPKGRHIYVYHVNVRTPREFTQLNRNKMFDNFGKIGAFLPV